MELHLAGRARPIFVEMVDISASGLRLRSLWDAVLVGQVATLRFVLSDLRSCAACGRVIRVERSGAFAIALDESNYAFCGFLTSLSADGL